MRGLEQYGGDVARFLEAFEDGHDLSGDAHAVLNTVAMATCYSGGELPFEPETGARRDDVWARWLEFDPVVVCERYAEALRGLELLYLEAGKSDEFHLQFGLRVLVRRLESLGIPHEHVEFEGGHFGLNGRYPEVLRRLVEAL